jgi:putative restriction endonuclease
MWSTARGDERVSRAHLVTPSIASTAFIANTDFGWLSHFLNRTEPPDEVDFWQPSPHGFKAIPPGAPFFFRLGAPHKAIAGYGFFARYERVPVWLAWG